MTSESGMLPPMIHYSNICATANGWRTFYYNGNGSW